MLSKQHFSAFVSLGNFLQQESATRENLLKKAETENPWFTRTQMLYAFNSWAQLLTPDNLNKWSDKYSHLEKISEPKTIGIIMAGNIPMVGFHDLLSVLISDHKAIIKPSSDDQVLLKFIVGFLSENGIPKEHIQVAARLENFDAVIATGSNNSNRYFEYYFAKVPHLLRRNRTSIGVLTGHETKEQLHRLGEDIFRYFGLGCRNVAKLYIPENYDLATFFEGIFEYSWVMDHNKYMNNHDYYHAIYLLNQQPFLDNNFLLVKEGKELHSPIAVLHYERYQNLNDLIPVIESMKENLQCVVGETGIIPNEIPFGSSQQPALWDYADGADTVRFLHSV